MKSKFYIFSFLIFLSSCKTPYEKTLGCYHAKTFSTYAKEATYLSFNRSHICILTSEDSTHYAYWELKNDTISILELGNFDTLTFVRTRNKLHVLINNSLDSMPLFFRKTTKQWQIRPECETAACAFRSTLQSADKLYQVAQSTENSSLLEIALDLYWRAESIIPGDPHTREMIEILTHNKNRLEEKKECTKILSKADQLLEKKDYNRAMEFYKIYLNQNCNYFLEHVKNRILLLDSLQN